MEIRVSRARGSSHSPSQKTAFLRIRGSGWVLASLISGVDPSVVGELGEGEDGLLLDLDVAVLAGEFLERLPGLLRSHLADPKNGLLADVLALGAPGQGDELVDRGGQLDLADGEDRPFSDLLGPVGAGGADEEAQALGVVLLADPEGRVLAQLVRTVAAEDLGEERDDESRRAVTSGGGEQVLADFLSLVPGNRAS